MNRSHSARQRGAATLVVVMVIFFIMALMAAYASRNLIFEQKTASNQYRSTQALEAAQAGIEWATALLNGGRVDASCLASSNTAYDNFRSRYLDVDDNGMFTRKTWVSSGRDVPLTTGCVRDADGLLRCSCPSGAEPVVDVPTGVGNFPAFQVQFEGGGAPGLVRLTAYGCTQWSSNCLSGQGTASGDAAARISVVLGLARALATPPVAALTVRGDMAAGSTRLHLHNTDRASNGITLNTGGSITASNLDLVTVPGSIASRSMVGNDASVSMLSADQMFSAFLGMARSTYGSQPAAVRIADCTSDCAARLSEAYQAHPGRPIVVNTDLVLAESIDLGTADVPVVLVVNGNITLTGPTVRIVGAVYSRATNWAHSGGNALIQGAAVAEGNFQATSELTVHYDAAVLNRIYTQQGSLVLVPGSWRDF